MDGHHYAAAVILANGQLSHFMVRDGQTSLPVREGHFYLCNPHGERLSVRAIKASEAYRALTPEQRNLVLQAQRS